MGIFDFFKKKNNREEDDISPIQYNEISDEKVHEDSTDKIIEEIPLQPLEEKNNNSQYGKIKIYNDYIMYSIALQMRGDYAPISAYEKENGEIEGFLYLVTDESYGLSAQQVIDRMEEKFNEELQQGKIKSYVIIYHSQFDDNGDHSLATNNEELKAITLSYQFENSDKAKIALPYIFENENITYKGFAEFTQEENNEIMDTQLLDNKDYFTNREEIKVPEMINEIGIKMKKSNIHNLVNTWSGIFGHESFRSKDHSNYLIHLMALCRVNNPEFEDDRISRTEFKDVRFKTLFTEEFSTIYPEVKTDFSLDFETKEINEWENTADLEAIVAGSGRDTFGVWFFATDYAENKKIYATQKYVHVNISGIVFVLDIHTDFDLPDGTKMSKEFTTYMPSKDLPNYACFDFIGQLIDFKETELLADGSITGYILKLRLITNEEMDNFFTIDAFVNKENIRFDTLTKGMKLTGALQLQGKIVE